MGCVCTYIALLSSPFDISATVNVPVGSISGVSHIYCCGGSEVLCIITIPEIFPRCVFGICICPSMEFEFSMILIPKEGISAAWRTSKVSPTIDIDLS